MSDAVTVLSPVPGFRRDLLRRGGAEAARCMQCATCTSVCDLTSVDATFPRRQILWAQWGLADRLAADPSIWLCHQCNDCTARCPRDAAPGDAMQAIRSLVIERLGSPRPVARLVANARTTWPVLLGVPILLWALYVRAVTGFEAPVPLSYTAIVPTWMIYSVFLPAAAFAVLAALVGARRSWSAWGAAGTRRGGVVAGLAGVAADILAHRRFARCGEARPRRSGHLVLVLGFAGAFVTTSLLGVAMDLLHVRTPLPPGNAIKLLGNASAILLVVGLALLVANRLRGNGAGRTRAYDGFFLSLVVVVVLSGVGAELGRIFLAAPVAIAIYLVHLGSITTLFLTFPFSKFAHALYRTLAMAHERLVSERSPS